MNRDVEKGNAAAAFQPSSDRSKGGLVGVVPLRLVPALISCKTTSGGGAAFAACLLYSVCSVGMVLSNKALASSYKTDLNVLLLVFQALAAIVFSKVAEANKWIERTPFSWKTARDWLPVNVLFCGMLFTGLLSLQTNNVPMVTVFKNVANVFTTAGDCYFFGSQVDAPTLLSFGVMLAGAGAAACGDVSITFDGLFWMLANCVFTSAYVLYLRHATKTIKISKFGMVFYNNFLALLLLAPVCVINGEGARFLARTDLHVPEYAILNVAAGGVGFFLNFASLSCVELSGPTTYSILGSLNKIPTVLLGYIFFHTIIVWKTWLFISISLLGGFIYTWAKLREQKR